MLQKIISQSNSVVESSDILNLELTLPISEITLSTVYWFTPYRVAENPLNYDKDFFFLYSTDHDGGDGGIYIGKGNNLDLSDFVEVGKVKDLYQCETPFFKYFPTEVRPFKLYYHTALTNPINTLSIQETNLITTNDDELTTATFTQETNPLSSEWQSGDDHLGYFKFWEKDDGTLRGVGYRKGAVIPTVLPVFTYYTVSVDGLTVTRDGDFDAFTNAPENYFFSPAFGEFFKLFNKWWWIGTLNSTLAGGETKKLAICRSNGDFEILEVLEILNNSEESYTWSFYIDKANMISHCYLNDKTTGVWHATYNLQQLQNY